MSDDGFVPMGDTVHIRVEEDIVFVRNFRVMTLVDLNIVMGIYRQVRARHGTLFAMFDSTHGQGMERTARQALTRESDPTSSPNATAIFGAPFALRTLGNMIERARIGLRRTPTRIKFFETEAQARAHLQAERERLKAER